MKSVHMRMGAGLDGLVVREHPVPVPGPREALIRVHAVSLNYREISILINGRYPLPVRDDVVAVSDGAGEVVALGADTSRARIGDRVTASIFPRWSDGPFRAEVAGQLGGSLDGMLSEYVVLPEEALVPVPAHWSYEEAATLPCAGVTAWNALTGGVPLRAGDDVLTLGSGGVSLFALQFAKAHGARVIATTSNDAKAEKLRALGADAVVNYRAAPEWAAEVRRLTNGAGVQHVIEVGGGSTLPQSLRAVAWGGEIAFVGTVGGAEPSTIDAGALFASAATVRVVAAGNRAQLAAAARCAALHRIRPVIDRVFDFDDARQAFATYAKAESFGKVVIRVAASR